MEPKLHYSEWLVLSTSGTVIKEITFEVVPTHIKQKNFATNSKIGESIVKLHCQCMRSTRVYFDGFRGVKVYLKQTQSDQKDADLGEMVAPF